MAYWLFKTEPSEFSIDDLQNIQSASEPWDGIRNYQARNILRDQVKVNDLVLIYHSSCKNVGAVGTAKVIKPSYPDPAQFNPDSRYFDAKANKDEPRWFCVDVEFASKFTSIVSLAQIKQTSELADMVLVKQGRLSIQPVSAKEWKIINQLGAKA